MSAVGESGGAPVKRLLVVPAAGTGSRLGSPLPKLLHPVAGRPMLDHLVELYRQRVDEVVLVVAPAAADAVRARCRALELAAEIALQPRPTGMLPAILAAAPWVERLRPERVWITWCDQVAIAPRTVERLARASEEEAPDAALTLPTARLAEPYVHFVRDAGGRIVDVLHRREGDAMPAAGESDAGLFCLVRDAFAGELARFAGEARPEGGSGEANFLPFVPWLARRRTVHTFPVTHPIEALGINTPDDLRRVEAHLRERGRSG
jgi:bifunctional UDP-N-acetylglucosamine pyrophosphorylase/glucosamine-1-phosphate N-acetyltransferase